MTRFACALVGIGFLAVADLRADNWPTWRGPDNNGVTRSHRLPICWSESKNIVWKLPLPGKAGSTPVLWGDRIFLTSSKVNDFVLLCIRTDGKPLWERLLARAVEPASKKDEGNEGAASPSTDGKYVYTFVWSGAAGPARIDGKDTRDGARGHGRIHQGCSGARLWRDRGSPGEAASGTPGHLA